LIDKKVSLAPLLPSNCGFNVAWSEHFVEKFAGAPIKTVRATVGDKTIMGEFVATKTGVEGSLIYTFSAILREQLKNESVATLHLDLVPGKTVEQLSNSLGRQNPKHSLTNRLRKGARLTGVKAAMVRECCSDTSKMSPEQLAQSIKSVQLPILSMRPIDEAISTAGGIELDQIDANQMLRRLPGTFVAGEMLDWEAPTGGYLITACLATGRAAGEGVLNWLSGSNEL